MFRSISILLAMLFLIPGASALCGSADDKPVMANQKFDLKESERRNLERDAMLGEPESAFKVALYYEMVAMDLEKGKYWMQIAAENGNTTAMNNFSYLLTRQEDDLSHLRALYWLRRSADTGDSVAIERLERQDGQ